MLGKFALVIASGAIMLAMPRAADAQCWACGLSGMGNAMSAFGDALVQQELQKEQQERAFEQQEELLRQQHEQQKEVIQRQHELDMQRLREQQQQAASAAKVHLEQVYPAWRTIVGAPATAHDHPDMTVPFRRWLARKDAAYQSAVNNTHDPAVVESAIAAFETESRQPGDAAAEGLR